MESIELNSYATHDELVIDKEKLDAAGIYSESVEVLVDGNAEAGQAFVPKLCLMVRAEDWSAAQAVVRATEHALEADAEVENETGRGRCPQCGSNHTYNRSLDRAGIFGITSKIASLFSNKPQICGCYHCDHVWKVPGKPFYKNLFKG